MEGKIVLVVEDDKNIRDPVKTLLVMEGYEVLCASNGQEALDMLQGSKLPRLILLDLMMPVMDGFMFREIQRTLPVVCEIPVVIMSADGNITSSKAAIGARDYLRKPVDIDDLLECIAAYF
jgi:CheY-like chemotaxis protein